MTRGGPALGSVREANARLTKRQPIGHLRFSSADLTPNRCSYTLTEHMFDSPTSNRRAGLFAGTLLVAAALFLGHAVPSSGAGHPRHHRVRAGETLWGIASAGYPSSDPRAAVDRIEHANHLGSASIVPGQVLLLP
jgi:hypothetical protein